MTRVLVLSPRHLSGYRDLVVADSRGRGENPITVLPFADRRSYVVACGRWVEVCDKLVVYQDFASESLVQDVVDEAESLGVEVEWRTLGNVPKPSWGERIAGYVA